MNTYINVYTGVTLIDEAVQNVTNELSVEVNKMMKEVIGRSLVFLNGDRLYCRKEECNMGKF